MASQETLEAEVVSYGEMTPDPPKIDKNKFVLKCFLGHFQCSEQFLFLVENQPIRTPPPS